MVERNAKITRMYCTAITQRVAHRKKERKKNTLHNWNQRLWTNWNTLRASFRNCIESRTLNSPSAWGGINLCFIESIVKVGLWPRPPTQWQTNDFLTFPKQPAYSAWFLVSQFGDNLLTKLGTIYKYLPLQVARQTKADGDNSIEYILWWKSRIWIKRVFDGLLGWGELLVLLLLLVLYTRHLSKLWCTQIPHHSISSPLEYLVLHGFALKL